MPFDAARKKAVRKVVTRNYRKEYDDFQGTEKQIKRRSATNTARNEVGLKKGDPREVDHKIPLSKGGSNGKGNTRIVARGTNRKKYDKTA